MTIESMKKRCCLTKAWTKKKNEMNEFANKRRWLSIRLKFLVNLVHQILLKMAKILGFWEKTIWKVKEFRWSKFRVRPGMVKRSLCAVKIFLITRKKISSKSIPRYNLLNFYLLDTDEASRDTGSRIIDRYARSE